MGEAMRAIHMYYNRVLLGWSYSAPEVRIILITSQINSITLAQGLMYIYIVH